MHELHHVSALFYLSLCLQNEVSQIVTSNVRLKQVKTKIF